MIAELLLKSPRRSVGYPLDTRWGSPCAALRSKIDGVSQVERAKEEFKVGNLFEVVLSQTFKEPCSSR